MSDYASIAERARKAFASVSKLEAAYKNDPQDRALQMNLKSMRRLAEKERIALEEAAARRSVEICRYRIIPYREYNYPLLGIAESLSRFQQLFSQIYDAKIGGARERARIRHDLLEKSMLNLGYTYTGSLGITLLVQGERGFFEGTFDSSIDALYDVLEIESADAVRDLAHSLGRAVVKRIYDWAAINGSSQLGTDIGWTRSDGRLLGQVIDHNKYNFIKNIITESEERSENDVTVRGILVSGNLQRQRFQISVPDGETYSGKFDDDFVRPDMTLGKLYDARIKVTRTYVYAQDKSEEEFTLLRLEETDS